MAKSPLQTAVLNWQKRTRAAQASGIPSSAYSGLMRQDLTGVSSGQSSPMADAEVNVAVLSNVLGHPIVQDPQPKSSSPLDILGNIPSDIGGIIRGFIPGTVNFLHHLPSEISQVPSDLSSGDPHKMADDPILSLIPGWYDIFNAFSPAGRQELAQHPVGALLDAFPLAGKAASVATAGRAAEVGSALEAAKRGSVVRAGGRAAMDAASAGLRRAGASEADLRASLQRQTSRLTLSQPIRELSRHYSIETKLARNEAEAWKDNVFSVMKGLTPDDRRQLVYAATHRGDPSFDLVSFAGSPEKAAVYNTALDHIDGLNQYLAKQSLADKGVSEVITPAGTTEIYSRDDPAAKAYRSVLNKQRLHSSASNDVQKWSAEVQKREAKFQGNVGKVRHFQEDPASFSARPDKAIRIEHVTDAIRPLVTAAANGRIESDIRDAITRGDVTTTGARVLNKDLHAVYKELTKFHEALKKAQALRPGKERSAAIADARKSATQLARIFKHKSWDHIYQAQTLRDFMSQIRDELVGISSRSRKHGYAARSLNYAIDRLERANGKLHTRKQQLSAENNRFAQVIQKRPPARFQPLIEELQRKGLHDRAAQLGVLGEIEHVIQDSIGMDEVKQAMGDEHFRDVLSSAMRQWMDLARQGYDPVWMHHVDPNRYESILNAHPLSDRILNPDQWKASTVNFAPKLSDVAAGVTDAGVELIERRATERFINTWVMNFVVSAADLEKEVGNTYDSLPDRSRRLSAAESRGTWIQKRVGRDYRPWNPEQWGLGHHTRLTNPEQLYVPVGVYNALRLMAGQFKGPFQLLTNGAYQRSIGLYKFSVLTGPRHIVHVVMGGMMFAMLREPRTMLQLVKAYHMVKDGKGPIELYQPLYNLKTDQPFQYKAGQTLARHYAQVIGDKAHALARFEEFSANVMRVGSMLAAESRGLSREAAIQEALKVYIDMDGMSPAERVIIKQVFPFYSFTRHLFKYLLSYPVDHPVRAAILTRFAEQEQAEWKTGLPKQYQQMLFIGKPDANGNVYGVDYKNINPFRSIANDFSFAGFFQSLNPFLSTIAQSAGINTLTGTPDLYPGVDYDPNTGTLTATHPNLGLTAAEQFVPELSGLDAVIGVSDRMRRLKESSPQSYRRELFNAFNLPFAQGSFNVPYQQARAEMNRYRGAQTALDTAEKTRNWSQAEQYNLVPYQGYLTPPSSIAAMYEAIQQALDQSGDPNLSARSVLVPRRTPPSAPLKLRARTTPQTPRIAT